MATSNERISVFQYDNLKNFNATAVREGEKTVQLPDPSIATESTDIKEGEDEVLTALTAPGVVFKTADERTKHYKSDWHRWNLKLRAAGIPVVSKEEFDQLSAADLALTLEDNDESDGEEQVSLKPLRGSNRVHFTTPDSKTVIFWKSLIKNPSDKYVSDLSSYVSGVKNLYNKKKWVIMMSSGGRFAGAVFNGNKCEKHKSFQRYTVRKKQGGSQSTKDKTGQAPKSAGATMRRYNEKRFREDIADLLGVWEQDLKAADFIFLVAPGANYLIFFTCSRGFNKDDNRIRTVPFTTRRPSLDEVKRIHHVLSTVEVLHTPFLSENVDSDSQEKIQPITDTNKEMEKEHEDHPPKPNIQEKAEEDLLARAIVDGDLNRLKDLIEADYEQPVSDNLDDINPPLYLAVLHGRFDMVKYLIDSDTEDLNSRVFGWFGRTALHRACADGSSGILSLLLESGADPTVKDLLEKTPYQLAKNKQIRELIRKYAGLHINQWNWEKAGVAALTQEMVDQKKQNEAEKKKRKKQQRKKRDQEKKLQAEEEAQRKLKEEAEMEERRLVNLASAERAAKLATMSDREKRALAAESRMASMGTVRNCDFCSKPLTMVPFQRLTYKYCSVECVKKHMDKLSDEL